MRTEGNGSFRAAARPNMASAALQDSRGRVFQCQHCRAQHMGHGSPHLHLLDPCLFTHGKLEPTEVALPMGVQITPLEEEGQNLPFDSHLH